MNEVRNKLRFKETEGTKYLAHKGIEYLLKMQDKEGLWNDFYSSSSGEGTDWITGYTGLILYDALDLFPDIRLELQASLDRAGSAILMHQQPNFGWGFNISTPSDADSTSFCIRFLSKLNRLSNNKLDNAINFILIHQFPDGGFSTYHTSSGVEEYFRPKYSDFQGWYSPHLCVVPSVIEALKLSSREEVKTYINKAIKFIRKSQSPEGFWRAYWWDTDLYATSFCMKILVGNRSKTDNTHLDLARKWLDSSQLNQKKLLHSQSASTPFMVALKMKAVLLLPQHPHNKKLLINLLNILSSTQLKDGSWPATSVLRVTTPDIIAPWDYTCDSNEKSQIKPRVDQNKVFTTATCLSAIFTYYKLLIEDGGQ